METDSPSANQESQNRQTAQDWLFEAFCQPRTMPEKWDLSEMSCASKANGNHHTTAAPSQRQADAVDQVEDAAPRTSLHIYYLNPFPEPLSYPDYWHFI